MHKALIIVTALAILTTVADARDRRARGHADRDRSQQLIACTYTGCAPVPRGCGKTWGRTGGGTPTGFDVLICPDDKRYY